MVEHIFRRREQSMVELGRREEEEEAFFEKRMVKRGAE